MNAYQEGLTAYINGMEETDNPYTYGTQEYVDWLKGFYGQLD